MWQHIIIALLDEEILKYFVYTGEHFTCVISTLLRNNNIAAAYVTSDVCLPGSGLRYLVFMKSSRPINIKSPGHRCFKRGIDR